MGDAFSRSELFDETDLDAAIAKFEELHPRTRLLENTASKVAERFLALLIQSRFARNGADAVRRLLQ